MKALPQGASRIHAARLSGSKPGDMVLVSTLGSLPGEGNPVVVLPHGEDPRQYDWRWALGLTLAVVYDERTKVTAKSVTRLLLEQKQNGISQVYLWRADTQRGWVAMQGASDPEVHLYPFLRGEQRAFEGLGCC